MKVVQITNTTRVNQNVSNVITGNSKVIAPGDSVIIDEYSLNHYHIYRQYMLRGLKYEVIDVIKNVVPVVPEAINTITEVAKESEVKIEEIKESEKVIEPEVTAPVVEEKKSTKRSSKKSDKSDSNMIAESTKEVDSISVGGDE